MNKRTKLTGAAIFVIPMSGLLAPTAAADTTMTLFEHDTVQIRADLATPGPGPGDQFQFRGDVFDRPGGAWLGTTDGICTTVTGNDTTGQTSCGGSFNLAGGQIMIAGVIDTAAFVRGDTVPLSIVGGTGMYDNARGSGTAQVPAEVPNQTDANFVLNLTSG